MNSVTDVALDRTYEPFDIGFCRTLVEDLLGPIADVYFRPRIIGADRIPHQGPLVLAANHSGTAFPYDAIVLDGYLWKHDALAADAKLRTLFEKELTLAWWMRPFGIDNFWRRGGGIDTTFDNFDELLRRGERVLYFPEGVPGIGKGFVRRYRLQPFRTSFIVLAARHRVPVIPIYIINAEWVMPFHVTWKPLDRLAQRFFHVPFFPFPAGPLAWLFPWMWYLALPAHMTYVVGEPIQLEALLEVQGVPSGATPSREIAKRVAEDVRQGMQRELDRYVEMYGNKPYDWRSLLSALGRARGHRWSTFPFAWPLRFVRFERDRWRPPARNRWRAFLRDLDLVGFYLPFGWALLSLSRRLRRPPHGYRGLSREARHAREGTFVWRLAERPLPPRQTANPPAVLVGGPARGSAEKVTTA